MEDEMMRNTSLSSGAALIGLACALAIGCAGPGPEDDTVEAVAKPHMLSQTVYYGGDILTMAGDQPQYVEAVLQLEGKIIFAGEKEEALARVRGKVDEVDLEGRTMVPGFIDAHGHVKNVGLQALTADLLPPPDSDVDTIAALQEKLREWGEGEVSEKLGWIIGFGYDDSQLAEQRHPTRDDLDEVSSDRPIFIVHQSGHLYVANSKLLELAGVTAETEDPPGGVIRRRSGSREPDGVLEETGLLPILGVLPEVGDAGQRRMVEEGIASYTEFGFTTANEGRAFPEGATLRIASLGGSHPPNCAWAMPQSGVPRREPRQGETWNPSMAGARADSVGCRG
jgi:predicted amidohydrolase YtcJ